MRPWVQFPMLEKKKRRRKFGDRDMEIPREKFK
jgi:hypothetical protein